MALPKLNDSPKYDIVIPSTGKKVKFRPYLVKEEKTLLLAIETQDTQQTMNAVADVVVACIYDDIDKESLTTFDIEYLMLKIRSKSVGEKANLNLKCEKCDNYNEYTLNLDDIKMETPKANKVISLTDKVSLKMKWPSYTDISSNSDIINSKSQVEQSFLIVASCIESIQTEEENILVKDVDKSEIIEFIESFTTEQYNKIKDFIDQLPKLEHTIEYDCNKCGHHNTLKLEGMADFF